MNRSPIELSTLKNVCQIFLKVADSNDFIDFYKPDWIVSEDDVCGDNCEDDTGGGGGGGACVAVCSISALMTSRNFNNFCFLSLSNSLQHMCPSQSPMVSIVHLEYSPHFKQQIPANLDAILNSIFD